MHSLNNLKAKLKELDDIEKDVAQALHAAGQALTELGKDKPTLKPVEANTTNFLKTLQSVESNLSKHIVYLSQVSTVQPHEGSNYAAQKVFHMALHRLEHARSRMNELERVRQSHLQQDAQYNPPIPPQMPPQQPPMRGPPPQQQPGQPGSMGPGGPQQGMMMQPGIGQDMGPPMGQPGMQMNPSGPMDSPLGPGMGQAMGPGMGQNMGMGPVLGSGMGHNMNMGQAQQMNPMGAPMGNQQMMWQQNQMGMGQQMGMGSMGPGGNMGQSPMP
ncbi:mediator of RNA polymerase II transcription subunit 11 [Galendromus occidentalis]|uniref:Mediator of RNA polymerase II transcription subunit 11 n=1 Tax=Galendromus occidentalis TaxID=34638 RepID=A0AAJ6QPR6_9ACAR|nr:mediator of RNA polymerase II transcription subunit 11 [Galendromus occidentalis]